MTETTGFDTSADVLPALPFGEWKDTLATLHMWTQIVGKIRMVQTPWTNHSWHVTLYVTPRGLTTGTIPYGVSTFQIDFDFIDHLLIIGTSNGEERRVELRPRSVANFYAELLGKLRELGLEIAINTMPNELPDPVSFDKDEDHASYDQEYAERFFRLLAFADRVFGKFRTRFTGKCSPVHFFWGSFDLAVTRFSGRTAPEHPGGFPNLPDWVTREAYSHEVSSGGLWFGNGDMPQPLFYSYVYPVPEGFAEQPVKPDAAQYSKEMGEFVLLYDDLRKTENPDVALMDFLQSTYEAAANAGMWEREALEWKKQPSLKK